MQLSLTAHRPTYIQAASEIAENDTSASTRAVRVGYFGPHFSEPQAME